DVSAASFEKPRRRRLLGMGLANASEDVRKEYRLPPDAKGIVVTEVDAASAAANKKIVAGDRIVEVSQTAIGSVDDIETQIDAITRPGKQTALLLIARTDGAGRFVALPLQEQGQSAALQECDRLTTFSSEQLFAGGDAAKAIAACRQALDSLPN